MVNSTTVPASQQPEPIWYYIRIATLIAIMAVSLLAHPRLDFWMLYLAGYFAYASANLVRLIVRHSKSAANSTWPRSVLLMAGTLTVVTSQGSLATFCQATRLFWNVSSFEQFYQAFLGPVVLGAILTLCILALIEAGGINPLIDQCLQATMGSRTYREIHAEHHLKQATPSETQAPTQEEFAAAQSNR